MLYMVRGICAIWILLCGTIAHAAVDMSIGRSNVAAYTGSFKTDIPIPVAPGRTGLQPSLALKYTSGMANGLYGAGWDLDIARIERGTKNGRPGYTDSDTFVLAMQGARQTLVRQTGGEWRVRNEGAFLRIRKQGNGWVVQDKGGTKYFFGLDDASQQSVWPTGVAQAFSWHLSKVTDINGNVMRFFYANDADGQRISHIDYAPGNQVVFSYEARSDIIQNYRSGFPQRISVRLKSVKSYAGNVLAQHLELVYGNLADDARSLLTQAIVHDPEGRLPDRVTRFSYAAQQINSFTGRWEKTPEYVQTVYRSFWSVSQRMRVHVWDKKHIRYVDMNGDGKAELIYLDDAGSMAVGYGTLPNRNWAIPEAGVKQYCSTFRKRNIYGRYTWITTCLTPAQYQQRFSTSWGLSWRIRRNRVRQKRSFDSRRKTSYYPRALVDMNGDGLPDWAVKTAGGAWHVYLNNGRVFNAAPQVWGDPSGVSGQYLLDVNGDGLPDLLQGAGTAYLNLGDRFSATSAVTGASAVPYLLGVGGTNATVNIFWRYSRGQPRHLGRLTPVLTPSLWRSTPLMISKTNVQTGLKQAIDYQVQASIANAPKLKLSTVARVTTSGSAVENHSVAYAYTGGLYAKSVKEFRGFATVTATDEQSGRVTTTGYHQDIVFQGRPVSVETRLADGTLVLRVTNTWSAKQYDGGRRHFPYISQTVNSTYELDGSLVSQTTTDNTYDGFGNLTASTSRNGGFVNTVGNLYQNNASCGTIPQARTRMVTVTKTRMATVTKYRWVSRFQRYVGSARYRRNAGYRFRINRLIRRYPYGSRQRYTVQAPQNYTVQVPETYYVQVTDPNCWQIGQLVQATVTKATPAGDTATRISSFAYDAKGRLIEETIEPGGSVWQKTAYAYDGFGNRTTATVSGAGISPRTTTVAYNANGLFPVSTTNALGHAETYSWDARLGVKTSLTGPNGLTTTWSYDGFGRKVAEVRADGARTDITYHMDAAPLYVTTQSTSSPAKTAYSDARGRVIRTEAVGFDGSPVYADTEYDALGREARKSLPYTTAPGGWTSYAYDALNRAISVTAPDGSVASTAYAGLTTIVTNALRQTKTTVKNSIGKVVSITDAANGVMRYAYDAFGNLTQTTDAAGNVTSMTYDIRGRKTSMTDPDMGYWTYAYDALGNLTRQTDAKGQSTTMVYDKLGRMISRTEVEGTSTWTYDTQWVGALSSETGGVASKSYIYDTYGRVKSTTATINGQAYNVGTTYDNTGRVSTITYPTGLTIQRNYNAFGFLQSVSNAASGAVIWQANAVDEFGHATSESFGNGVVTTHTYDNIRGVLTGFSSTSGTATIQDASYGYDAIGNMTFRKNTVAGYAENFAYDNLNRLTQVHNAAGVLQKQYQYDAIGNIIYKSDVGSYAYDPNHPHAVSTAGNNTYAYDTNGNQVSGAGRSFTWTSFNKPSGISTANGYTGFAYDANHNRVLKTTPTSTTAYIGKIYQQTTMNGVIKDVSNIYAGNKLVASIEDVAGFSTIKYMHGDHLGSISVITDANGAVIERLRFDVFGTPVNPNTGAARASFGATNTDRGFTGHEMDASTGLINMNARLYDPVLGRFISADTIVPSPGNMQGFNRYSYVLNNPLLYIDPTGHSWWTNFRDSVLKPVVIVVVAVVVAYYAPPLGASVASALSATGTAATVISGAVVGASAGFAAGATGAGLYGGSLGDMWSAGLKGAGAGAIMGGVGGAYGDAWSLSRVGATSIAGGFAAKSAGGSFNQGFKIALVTSMVRLSWEKTRGITNNLKMKTLRYGGKVRKNQWGEILTDGSRGVRPGTPEIKSIFGNMTMAGEGLGQHLYNENSWVGRFVNWTSKAHDFWNSGGYDWGTGFVGNSDSSLYGSLYDVWSFSGMLPAAAFTGVAMAAPFSVPVYDAAIRP